MIKFIIYFLQSVFIYLFFLIGKLIGLEKSRKLFPYIFQNLGKIFRSKKIIKSNLNNLPKNISESQKNKIEKKMWRNYGMTFIEYVFLNILKKNDNHRKIKGGEILDNIITNDRPVIFISGHFANYELMSMEITKKNLKLATIYRPLNNFFLNPFMEYLRKKYVCKNQIKKGINGVREAIEFIKKNYSIALMVDQRVTEGEKINLFNKPAFTSTLPAQLALKYKLPIVPVYIERTKSNFFEIEFFKEIDTTKFNNKIELTNKLNQVIEEMILRNPSQWIWTHNRWK